MSEKPVDPEAFQRVRKAYESLHAEYRKVVARAMGLESFLMLYCILHPHPEYEQEIKELCPALWVEFTEWREAERRDPPPKEESVARKIWRLLEEAQVEINGERAYIAYSSGDPFGEGEYVRISTTMHNSVIIEFPTKKKHEDPHHLYPSS